ncbi:MAG: drug/metabolite transporter (DMT)-like permease [Planctomycetota bacterium]|jgi:drug/metabolite transporter (DMT)-like permease
MTDLVAVGLGLFSAFSWGVGSLLFSRALKGAPKGLAPPSAAGANLFKNILASCVFLALWPVLGGALPGWPVALFLALSGILGFAMGDTFYFAALPRAGVQRAAMIGMLNVPVAALLGWAFFAEELDLATVGAMAVVLLGVCLVVLDRSDGGGSSDPAKRRAGVLFSLGNVGAIALAVVLGHNHMGEIKLVPAVLCRMAGGILGAFLLAPVAGLAGGSVLREVRALVRPLHTPALWKALSLAALVSAVIGLLPYHLALAHLPSGVAAVLFATTPLFTLPLGLAMGDRFGWRAVVGTLVGYAGMFAVVASLGFGEAQDPVTGLEAQESLAPGGELARFPRLAVDPAGVAHSLWTRVEQGQPAELRLAHFDGKLWSDAETVASGDNWFINWADRPNHAWGADGSAWFTWLERTASGSYDYEVRLASRSAGAIELLDGALHEDRKPAEHGFVSVVPNEAAGAMALWLDGRNAMQPGGAMGLYARPLAADGSKGPEELVDARVCDCCSTSLARMDDGSLVAAWRDRSADEVRDIALARRVAGTTEWTQPVVFYEDNWMIEGCPVNGPVLTAQGQQLALVWFTLGSGADAGPRVCLGLSKDGGQSFGERVVLSAEDPQGRVDATYLADGTLLVSWLERGAGALSEWRVQAFDAAGEACGEALVLGDVSGERGDGWLSLCAHGSGALAQWTVPGEGLQAARIELLRGEPR